MEVTTRQKGDEVLIKVAGAVDTDAAERLRAELAKVAKLMPKGVIMDLSRVPSIGSSGIGKILAFYKELNGRKATFKIKGIHENLYNIFKSIKLEKLFPISMT
jgi:anti-anti-sigma factor